VAGVWGWRLDGGCGLVDGGGETTLWGWTRKRWSSVAGAMSLSWERCSQGDGWWLVGRRRDPLIGTKKGRMRWLI
jgi:hypothetical protein